MFGYVTVVKLLLVAGSDPTLRNKDGFIPSELAVKYGFPKVAGILNGSL